MGRPREHPTDARISAAVSRIRRHHGRAWEALNHVFGSDAAVTAALARRVDALLSDHDEFARSRNAEKLHSFVTCLAAVAAEIEPEDVSAADLGADLASILSECELLAAPPAEAEQLPAA